jgi:hypothetical protein
MNVRADDAKPAGLNEALSAIVRRFRADSGTIHFLQQDGLRHLAAATAGLCERAPAPTIVTRNRGTGQAGEQVEVAISEAQRKPRARRGRKGSGRWVQRWPQMPYQRRRSPGVPSDLRERSKRERPERSGLLTWFTRRSTPSERCSLKSPARSARSRAHRDGKTRRTLIQAPRPSLIPR